MNAAENTETLKNQLKVALKPYLKKVGRYTLDEGFSMKGYQADYIVRDSSGRPLMVLNVKKKQNAPKYDNLDRLNFTAHLVSGELSIMIPVILAVYDGNKWDFWNSNREKLTSDWFSMDKSKYSKRRENYCLFYVISVLFLVIGLAELVLPLFQSCCCHNLALLTKEIVALLCAGGIFAVLPSVLSRVIEIKTKYFTLVLDKAKE